MVDVPLVSNSAADRAGNVYRDFMAPSFVLPMNEQTADARLNDLLEAIRVVDAYRSMHAQPMAKVTMGIRSMVRTVRRDDAIKPGQRFKRIDRIGNKLFRYPHMRLSQMEDIGGCRVVLPSIDEVYRVLARIRHNWRDARIIDSIKNPHDDGYRGIHVVTRRDGRLVEVQLRTTGQHEWAEAIESSSPRVGFNLKDGAGPADLRLYFKLASDRIAITERGEPADAELEDRFARLRREVVHYFRPST